MSHKIVNREEWLAARIGLLKDEKEHTRRSDELAKRRQELPWVRLDKKYRFDTEQGTAFYAQNVPQRSVHPQAFDFDVLHSRSITEVVAAVRAIDLGTPSAAEPQPQRRAKMAGVRRL